MKAAAIVAGASVLAAGILAAALASAGSGGLGRARHGRRGRALGKVGRDGLEPFFTQRGRDGQVMRGYMKDDLSIRERLELMQGMVAADVRDPSMRKLALQVTSTCPERDDACEIRAIYAYVKRNLRYSGDIGPHKLWPGGPVDGVDLYVRGKRALENGAEDCDGHTTTVSGLAVLNGFTAKFRATSPSRFGQNNYTHVYALVGYPKNDPKKWIPLDTTLPGDDRLGEEAPHAKALDVIA